MSTFKALKDPNSVLDFTLDWSAWLEPSADTISSFTVTADAGITVDSSTSSDGSVIAWLSGGTAGTTYSVEFEVTTTAGRVDQRSLEIYVEDR